MPNFLLPGRRDAGSLSDEALAALLAGTEPPAEATPLLQPVAEVMAALRAGPASDELAGEGAAMVEFRRSAGAAAARAPARRRRRPVARPVFGARAAVTAAVAALSLGGLATAAYAGVLPAPIQRFAHETIGAPAAAGGSGAMHRPGHNHLIRHTTPVGPRATGPAAHGLCTAYAHVRQHGTATQRAVAWHNLTRAAGGASHVTAFCRSVPGPGRSRSHRHGKKVAPGQAANPGKHGKAGEHGQAVQNGRPGHNGRPGQNGKRHSQARGHPPGKGSGQQTPPSNKKPSAYRTGLGEHPAPRPGNSAPNDPARHRAVTSRS